MKFTFNSFGVLCAIGILARFSYALARTPVLPLFALYLGAGTRGAFEPHSKPIIRTSK